MSRAACAPAAERNLLGLQGMGSARLRDLLTRARDYAGGGGVKPVLRGRTVANLFFEDSTRTRTSFSIAAKRLGAEVLEFGATTSSISKGETLIDTALNVEAMGVSALVVRARQSGAAHSVAGAVRCSVINAGDGRHEHPTQGLLDILTLAERFERLGTFDLTGLSVAIVGDAASSRVARSAIAGMGALGARLVCVGPPSMVPGSFESLGCRVERDLDSVLGRVDGVMTLRVQFERHGEGKEGEKKSPIIASLREYREMYAMTPERASRLKAGAVVMHPGPMNRGVEIDAAVADGPRSVILRQTRHGVYVRMAALAACVEGGA